MELNSTYEKGRNGEKNRTGAGDKITCVWCVVHGLSVVVGDEPSVNLLSVH